MTETTDAFDYQVELIYEQSLSAGFLPLYAYRLRHQKFVGGWSGEMVRECLQRGAAVAVLLYDSGRDQLVMVEQFRIGALDTMAKPWLLEVVAGLLEPGEETATVAERETTEETGCSVQKLELICESFSSPGCTTEKVVLYCGQIDSQQAGGVHGVATEDEDIRVQVLSREHAWDLLQQGQIIDAKTIIALQWLQLNYQRLQHEWG